MDFAEYLEGGEEFKLTTFRKPSGYMAFTIETEDGEKAIFESYQNIVLPLKPEGSATKDVLG